MSVLDVLDKYSARYELSHHDAVFTAQEVAQEEHVHGMNVAKPVVIFADGQAYVCVLPACCLIDFETLKSVLWADDVRLANESELEGLFPDCDIGAQPPFGSFYGLPTIMDDRLESDDYIVSQSGTHEEAIKMDMAEYMRVEKPRIFSFSYHI
ncbi:MAG TPA: YbaK/EbsC family protein [Phycisphaerales bacterium]|nr:YbaK/EbsC family protein [Phycisphaerales bacterium]